MSIRMRILKTIGSNSINHNNIRKQIFNTSEFLKLNEQSFYNELWRLSKKGFIKKDTGRWSVTNTGKEYLDGQKRVLLTFNSPFTKNSPRTLLLMFDIPELRRVERAWLRKHLKKFQYIMIQKSVWVGPYPLPRDFVVYMKEIKIEDCIKTFKLARDYVPTSKKITNHSRRSL